MYVLLMDTGNGEALQAERAHIVSPILGVRHYVACINKEPLGDVPPHRAWGGYEAISGVWGLYPNLHPNTHQLDLSEKARPFMTQRGTYG